MKKLNLILVGMLLILLGACAGSSSYNADKCKELSEKIDAKEELTESDYNDMIDQMMYCAKDVHKEAMEAKGNQEKEDALRNSEEFSNKMKCALEFSFYLSKQRKNLSPSNLEKLEKVEAELKGDKF